MLKLMIWAMRWGQSTPKVSAIPLTVSLTPPWANKINSFINSYSGPEPGAEPLGLRARQISLRSTFDQEESVEHNGFRKSDRQNGLDQHLSGGAGIASHR